MKKETLVNYAGGGLDDDVLRNTIDEVIDMLPFLTEWGQYRETRIHLNQETGEVLHYLVDECNEEPPWLRPELNHVPREDWEEYGITW